MDNNPVPVNEGDGNCGLGFEESNFGGGQGGESFSLRSSGAGSSRGAAGGSALQVSIAVCVDYYGYFRPGQIGSVAKAKTLSRSAMSSFRRY